MSEGHYSIQGLTDRLDRLPASTSDLTRSTGSSSRPSHPSPSLPESRLTGSSFPSLFPHPAPIGIPKVSAQQTLYKGADLHSSAILTFPETNGAVGFMTTSMAQTGPQTLVQGKTLRSFMGKGSPLTCACAPLLGTEGSIELIGPPYRPLGFIVRYKDEKKEEERHE